LTVCVKELEVDGPQLLSPLYAAVTVWLPLVRLLVANVAVPPLPSVTGVPAVPSTVNVTRPVGVKTAQETVAVKVMDWPDSEGLPEEERVVLAPAWPTTCVNVPEVETAQLALPLYAAVTVWVPTERLLVENVAMPPLPSITGAPVVPSIVNVTLPVGENPVQATVAEKVSGVPRAAGLAEDCNVSDDPIAMNAAPLALRL
jgi:hypothetical protein